MYFTNDKKLYTMNIDFCPTDDSQMIKPLPLEEAKKAVRIRGRVFHGNMRPSIKKEG